MFNSKIQFIEFTSIANENHLPRYTVCVMGLQAHTKVVEGSLADAMAYGNAQGESFTVEVAQ